MITIQLLKAEAEVLAYTLLDEITRVGHLQTELQAMGIQSDDLDNRMADLQFILKDLTEAQKKGGEE